MRGAKRTLRELLPITAAAVAAAIGVAVVVTPAMSYLDEPLSGLVNDIPNAVTAPVTRLLSPGDISVRVRPRTVAPQVALAEPEASPLELVTGQLGTALIRQDALGRDVARSAVVSVPEVTARVPFVITPLVQVLPPSAVPSAEAIPDEADDVITSDAAKRSAPSKEVREPKGSSERTGSTDSADTFSIAGIRSVEDSPEGNSKSSGAASSGSADAEAQKHRQQDGEKHAQEPPSSSEGKDNDPSAPAGEGKGEPEPKAKNSNPEKR